MGNKSSRNDPIDFNPEGKISAKLHSIYDGDTARFIVDRNALIPNEKVIINVRFQGFNAPELKPRVNNSTNVELEKMAGEIVKNTIKEKLEGKNITLDMKGIGVYGRFLARVSTPELDICDWAVDKNYGIAYDGKGKAPVMNLEQLNIIIAREPPLT